MVRALRILNLIFGGAVLILGYGAFFLSENKVALALAIALTVVGPLEDFLMKKYVKERPSKSEKEELIDQSTSLGFLVFLLWGLWSAI